MTELIKKSNFIAEIKNTMPQGTSRGVFLALIDDAPTTTEAEIRAKAQREIVEWCFDNKVDFALLERYANKDGVVDCVLKHFEAEQLKGESR